MGNSGGSGPTTGAGTLSLAWALAKIGETRDLAMSALSAHGRPRPDVQEVGEVNDRVASFVKGGEAYAGAAALLVENGYSSPAAGVMRTMVELDIDLAFILKVPQDHRLVRARMQHFWDLRIVNAVDQLQQMANLRLPLPPGVDLRAQSTRRKGLVDAYEPLRQGKWCEESLEARAIQTGRRSTYRWPYALGCGGAHSGAEALEIAALTPESSEPVLRSVCLFVAAALAGIVATASNYLQLGVGPRCAKILDGIGEAVQELEN